VTRAVPELLTADAIVTVGDRPHRIERVAGRPDKPIVRLEGCASREAAASLRGAELLAPPPPLEAGEYWARDLEGCLVVDGSREIGVVARMIALPWCEALEVGERLIPMVRDAIRSIDLEARRIDVDMEFVGE
jgi:16S rRNA processing protein RimM